ncbi:hypothetical protein [Fodinibius halophilus]|uniref:HTH domain-containing protein n=1 Tax=Fodinibius halophilus TaxID=1736908 RepID=A0A6M1T6J8_9BACT|nr:hypothetical protein [Fodinibius halophilus]NGP89757.1 hypothetical protein [Fodinibius halophilus]
MSLRTYLTRIRRLDAMIRRKSTGPPEELANKLDISERWLYKFLRELKEEFDCPITYDHYRESYIYEEKGKIIVGFENISEDQQRKVGGGFLRKIGRCIYLFSKGYKL